MGAPQLQTVEFHKQFPKTLTILNRLKVFSRYLPESSTYAFISQQEKYSAHSCKLSEHFYFNPCKNITAGDELTQHELQDVVDCK